MSNEIHDSEMLVALIEVAPPDVTQTIAWLFNAGFKVTRLQGGASTPFGNFVVEWERKSSRIKIIRDRNQWCVDIAGPGLSYAPLDRLLTAKNAHPIVIDWDGPRPEQIPPGVSWNSAVPELVDWIEGGDRKELIEDAVEEWGSAVKRHYGIESH